MLGRNIYRFAVVLLVLWSTTTGIAQVRSGSIVGLVVDPSGAPISDAAVTVLAAETNIRFETRTNVSGQYTVPYLAAGRYTVTVMREGFTAAKTSEIEVGTAQTARANVQLQLGSVANTVEVTNDVQLDGLSILGPNWNEVAVVSNSDGILEVRTSVNNYSAEYGRGQGIISVTTRGGRPRA